MTDWMEEHDRFEHGVIPRDLDTPLAVIALQLAVEIAEDIV